MDKKYNTIKCPHCDMEYFPGEIYLPQYFLGKPQNIERDYMGKIMWHDGLDQNLKEEFVCTNCNTRFTIEATITYKTTSKAYEDSDEYLSQKYNDRLILKED